MIFRVNAVDLREFFREHNKIALAFSGGADSAYLMYAGKHYGAELHAYYVKSPFQPEFERQDAIRLARELDVPITILENDVLCDEKVAENSPKRCYFCKKRIFSLIKQAALNDGCTEIIDGSNASDKADDRPGMAALAELKVLSPLRDCGITKDELREKSREAGLFTWNKPAYACLATRIPTGQKIDLETLEKVERGEEKLREMGFSDLRLRVIEGGFKLQLPAEQIPIAVQRREEILQIFKESGECVLLDLMPRKSD